ncbi:hypothetical protein RvY_18460 [Ramazzottius varieornatus]|uniref:Uncharacterized protein n=1 Tax=Ramazzottius varieornatus TaxID=947166 RepID=A0A1D1WAH4_RAMVA|nr:hypothetical protein RvY_18460 [Ramazzottius varieornatus]
MDDLLLLFLLALAMLVCSFLAGILPLLVNMSEEKLQFMTALGAGLLIGAALVVIIPEGVETVYSRSHSSESAGKHQQQDHPFDQPSLADAPAPLVANVKSPTAAGAPPQAPPAPSKNIDDTAKNLAVPHKDEDEEKDGKHEKKEAGSGVGAALITGFIFMLLVDQVSSRLSGGMQRNNVTATLGLVVHAAADGIALGASAMTKHLEMEMLVFFAIMLHKAPTAFGLVTFLLHEGMDKVRIRRHLLIFSLAAPIGALMTYFLIQMGSDGVAPSDRASGLVLLFSGGTFLYVAAVHVLPEISHRVPHASMSSASSYPPVPSHSTDLEKFSPSTGAGDRGGGLRGLHLLAIMAGAFLPLFLTVNHSH